MKGAMMNNNQLYRRLLVIVLGIIILSLIPMASLRVQESIRYNDVLRFYLYRIIKVFLLVSFGILIEHRKIMTIFRNGGPLNPYYLGISLVLIALLVVPISVGMGNLSSLAGMLSLLINNGSTRSVLGVLSGILLVRSIFNPKGYQKNL